jgi:hypothetical protein
MSQIRFDNREAAFKFLVEVDNAVKACLEKLQDRIISEVKKFAQEEWCRRIEVLVAFFKPMSQGPEEQSMEVISQLRDNVVSKLSEMSYTSLDVALNTFVANRMKDQNLSNKIFRFLRNPIKIFKTRKEASQGPSNWIKEKPRSSRQKVSDISFQPPTWKRLLSALSAPSFGLSSSRQTNSVV